MMLVVLTLVIGLIGPGQAQLIGHRGVVTIPDGQVYRDRETVEASEIAARFAVGNYDHETRIHENNKFHSRYMIYALILFQ